MAKKKEKKIVDSVNKKIREYIFLDITLVLIGIFLFDTLGLINLKRILSPVVYKLPGLNKISSVNTEDPYLLSREERKKEAYTLKVWEENLKKKDEELKIKEDELASKEAELEEEKKNLEMEKKSLEEQKKEYNDYKKNIERQAEYIESMRPEDAVARLKEMDDLIVIDILREIDKRAEQEGRQSIVSYLLSLFDPKRSSRLQEKMLLTDE